MTLKGLLVPLLWGVLASSASPVLAISGQVVDVTGKAVKGARACLVIANREGLCAETDEVGYYRLPDSDVSKVRISAAGFLPSMVAAVDMDRVIVLDRAASLSARLLDDASGESVAEGSISISYKTGRKRGPFPVNAAGVLIRTLTSGEVLVWAEAEGYRKTEDKLITLKPGERYEIVLRLLPVEVSEEANTKND